ncbi:hypothetical protein D6789_04060, partial [Candidatus Woesearchaeota archaeon]
MVFLSIQEVIDIIAMSLVVGLIFKDFFQSPTKTPEYYLKNVTPGRSIVSRLSMSNFWWAVALVAPSIILHEFGHKFVALAFGLKATFNAAYGWLFAALVLKYLLGFVFFVPAYVAIRGASTPLQDALTSFAGPAVNLALWLGAAFWLKNMRGFRSKKQQDLAMFLKAFSKINMFLFIFNMIPLPGFDGFHVLAAL